MRATPICSSSMTVKFLGDFKIQVNQQEISGLSTLKSKALLAYLLMEGQKAQSRSTLAAIFWPEAPEQTALHNLRQALMVVKKAFDQTGCAEELFLSSREAITLNPTLTIEVDALTFAQGMEELFRWMDGPPRRGFPIRRLQSLIDLYQGEFLPHLSLPDTNDFDDWVVLNRESLNRQAIQGLSWLLQYHENRGEWHLACPVAQKLIRFAPWDEQSHSRFIQCLLALSHNSAASAHYQTAVQYFRNELQVEPGHFLNAAKRSIEKATASAPAASSFQTAALPHFPTAFIGRARELDTLEAWIADPHCQIITLTGPGGSGKTRLAAFLAAQQVSLFQDGVYFASLANCSGIQQISASILQALGTLTEQNQDALEELLAWAEQRQALLVLDNVDDTPAAAAFAARLLERSPRLVLLFTAYSRLDLLGEKVFTLAGLSLETDPCQEAPSEAIQLYLSHLQPESLPEIRSTEFLTKVETICQLVEGMPLAIALAAGQTRCMSATDLVAELSHNLDVLRTSSANLPDRHRSIQASFENAWSHLSPQRQSFLARLTLFRAPFTAAAAEAICTIRSGDLRALAGESLLTWDTTERYRFHRTLWQYAREKDVLPATAKTALQQKYAEWFANRVLEFLSDHELAHFAAMLAQIEAELEDALQSLYWLIEQQDWARAKPMIMALFRYYEARGKYRAGSAAMSEIADACGKMESGLEAQVMASSRAALLALRIQQFTSAARWIEFAAAQATAQNWHEEEAFCLNVLATQAMATHSAGAGEKYALQALACARQYAVAEEEAHALYTLGNSRINKGELSQAEADLLECKHICQERKSWRKLMRVLNSLADTACYRSDRQAALDCYFQALEIAEGTQNPYSQALIVNNIGTVYMELQDYPAAQEHLTHSVELCQQVYDREGEAVALANLGEIALWQGERDQAVELCRRALQISLEAGSNWGEMSARIILAQTYREQADMAKARAELTPLLQMSVASDSLNFFYRALVEAAEWLVQTGRPDGVAVLLASVIDAEGMEEFTRVSARRLLTQLPVPTAPCAPLPPAEMMQHLLQALDSAPAA